MKDVIAATQLIRRCFQRMRMIGDGLHQDLGINSSLRALLEWLSENESQTVPQIAAAKSVSRQHVQKVADELSELGLVEFKPNPGHKRSPFVAMTAKGAKRFALMRGREMELFADLAKKFTAGDAKAGLAFLTQLNSELERIQGDISYDDDT